MSDNDGTGHSPDDPDVADVHGKQSADPKGEKRRRGRPPKGAPVLVRLSDEEREMADLLGAGVAAEGVRVALRAAARMGADAAKTLAHSPTPLGPLKKGT